VHLGPVAFAPVDADNGLAYNPRCLSRDLSLVWSNQTKPTDVVNLINSCTDLGCFDTNLEAIDGVHAGGHFTIGSLNVDAYASAGDPAFYLHHAQVDRVWATWQNLNAKHRTSQVYGTGTAFNSESYFIISICIESCADVLHASRPTQSERDIGYRPQFRRPCTSAASG